MARLNLDDLQPEPNSIIFRGVEYGLPGEMPVPDIIASLKMLERLRESRDSDDTSQTLATLEEMYGSVMRLLRDVDPNVPDLRFTSTDLEFITGLVASGEEPKKLEEAVRDDVAGKAVDDPDLDPAGASTPPDEAESGPPTEPPGAATPSRKRSRARSSASA